MVRSSIVKLRLGFSRRGVAQANRGDSPVQYRLAAATPAAVARYKLTAAVSATAAQHRLAAAEPTTAAQYRLVAAAWLAPTEPVRRLVDHSLENQCSNCIKVQKADNKLQDFWYNIIVRNQIQTTESEVRL